MRRYKVVMPGVLVILLCLSACAPAPVRTAPEPQAYPRQPVRSPEARGPYPENRPPSDLRGATIERQSELRKAIARGMRDEAYGLQQRGLVKEAITRYRESLFYWPDPGLDSYVITLERTVRVYLPQRSSPPPTPGKEPGTSGEVPAVIRNRSSQEVSIRFPEGTGHKEVLLLPGEIREVTIRIGPSGEITVYALQGGRTAAGRQWSWNSSDPSAVPAILYDDREPEKLMLMTGIRTR